VGIARGSENGDPCADRQAQQGAATDAGAVGEDIYKFNRAAGQLSGRSLLVCLFRLGELLLASSAFVQPQRCDLPLIQGPRTGKRCQKPAKILGIVRCFCQEHEETATAGPGQLSA